MGDWDCYCALCSVLLGSYVKFGSTKHKYLAKRRRRVDKKRRRLAGETVNDDSDESDPDVEMDEAGADVPDPADPSDEDRSSDEDFDPRNDESSSEEDSEGESEYSDVSDFNEVGEIEDVDVPIPDATPSISGEDDASIWSSDGELFNTDYPRTNPEMDGGRMDSYHEERSYDPTVLDIDSIKWLDKARCLGFNPNARSVSKAFISGRGQNESYGWFKPREASSDPNIPEYTDEWPCFMSHDVDEQVCFPFHEKCYKIFARCLYGSPDLKRIDKDALYSAMTQPAAESYHALNLYYGDIHGPEQFWECCQGEEYSVCDPGQSPLVSQTLQKMLPAELYKAPTSADLTHKVGNDPFSTLPYDVLYMIFPYLDNDTILKLMKASWCVNNITSNNDTWERLLKIRIFPWFWEAEEVLKNTADNFDTKRAFVWLNNISTPAFGMEGPWMGLANRRRIWAVCEELKTIYQSFLSPEFSDDSNDEVSTKEIMSRATSLQVPLVAHPRSSKLSKTISTQWVKSWSEVDSRPCVFETYWSASGGEGAQSPMERLALVSMCVKFGMDERNFNHPGPIDGKEILIMKAVSIETYEWISEIVLHIRDVDMLTIEGDRSKISSAMQLRPHEHVFIEGITLVLNSGVQHVLCGCPTLPSGLNRRVLAASGNESIVGIVGQVAKNHVIARLGILQSTRPGWEPTSSTAPAQLTETHRLLWADQATKLPAPTPTSSSLPETVPIWRHPTLSISPVSTPSRHINDVPIEMLAHQVLLWAPAPSAYRNLTAISAFCVVTGMGSYEDYSRWPEPGRKYKALIPDIIGLRAEYSGANEEQTGAHYKEIGTGGPVPIMTDPNWRLGSQDEGKYLTINPNAVPWEESNIERFEIDGAGGEVVTSVEVAEEGKAIKLRTNRERECYWGEKQRQEWTRMTAEEGRIIVGLVVCFGTLGGWSWHYKGYSHLQVTTVNVVTMPVEG